MQTRRVALALLLVVATGCESILDVDPADQIPDDEAITNAAGARTALAGAYNAVQSLSYYGGNYIFFNDLSADNAVNVGTSQGFADADQNELRADNGTIEGMWGAIYEAINRVNHIILRVPDLADLSDTERDQIVGEAYALRALHYHNLVKVWGGVPIRTEPATSVEEASQIARSSVDEVYAQIISDLQQAEGLVTDNSNTRQVTVGAVKALLARVYLYRQQWALAEAKADEVIALGYELAPSFADLFTDEGDDTPEDIFRIEFTEVDYNNLGYYYISRAGGGGNESLAPDSSLFLAFRDSSGASDARFAWSIDTDSNDELFGTKFPTTIGAEDPHVIRFAEVLLIKAEAAARQNQLQEAVDAYNPIRVRAGLAPHVLGVDVTTQADVLAEIARQRRLELAFEGDRWADLLRTGQAVAVLGIPEYQTLYPIPQSEIDVAPNIEQNPQY